MLDIIIIITEVLEIFRCSLLQNNENYSPAKCLSCASKSSLLCSKYIIKLMLWDNVKFNMQILYLIVGMLFAVVILHNIYTSILSNLSLQSLHIITLTQSLHMYLNLTCTSIIPVSAFKMNTVCTNPFAY